jgi:hypothetical protein
MITARVLPVEQPLEYQLKSKFNKSNPPRIGISIKSKFNKSNPPHTKLTSLQAKRANIKIGKKKQKTKQNKKKKSKAEISNLKIFHIYTCRREMAGGRKLDSPRGRENGAREVTMRWERERRREGEEREEERKKKKNLYRTPATKRSPAYILDTRVFIIFWFNFLPLEKVSSLSLL